MRGGIYYCVDRTTGKRTSLQTTSQDEGRQIVEAKNAAERQPVLNLQIAKAYIAGADSGFTNRTWQQAIESVTNTKQGANKERWLRVVKDRALAPLLPRVIIETQGEMLLKVLQSGKVSTNVYLRRLHNFCLDMSWLPWPLIPKRQWPAVRFKDKRAITLEEHSQIVAREKNPEQQSLLPTGMAPGRVPIGPGPLASRGCGLAGADHMLLSDENALAQPDATADSFRTGRWRPSWRPCRRPARSFRIWSPCGPATGPRSSSSVAPDWAFRA